MNDYMKEYFDRKEKIIRDSLENIAKLQDYNSEIENGLVDNIVGLCEIANEFVREINNMADPDNLRNVIALGSVKEHVIMLKEMLVARYNSLIESINNKVKELPKERILGLEIPGKFERKKGILFNTSIKGLDFDKLNLLNKEIDSILMEVNEENERSQAIDLLEGSILDLENEILLVKNNMNNGIVSKTEVKEELSRIFTLLKEKYFAINDSNNKLGLTQEQIDYFNDRISKIGGKLLIVELNLGSKKLNENVSKNNKYYLDLKDKLELLDRYLDYYDNLFINPKEGTFDVENISILENAINEYESKLEAIKKQVYIYYNGYINSSTGERVVFFDKVSLENLEEIINKIENRIKNLRAKFKNPSTYVEKSSEKVIELSLEEIEDKLLKLDEKIAKLKFIKDKKDKRSINKLISEVNDSIRNLDGILSVEPEKYKKLIERLNKRKKDFVHILEEVKTKSPKLVTRIKSAASNLYKKYEKSCLISAGISYAALSDMYVGATLIPAIMYGNEIKEEKEPSNKKFYGAIDEVLADVVGAKSTNDGYLLSNGIKNDSNSASTSILKSLASVKHPDKEKSSDVIKQLVVEVKGLMSKMKKFSLKEKLGAKKVSVVPALEGNVDIEIVNKSKGGRR